MNPRDQRRLLLIGWDAADWSFLNPLMDAGQMPTLNRIVEEGVTGKILCTDPRISVSQWTTIATGKRPWQHRICHSVQPALNGKKQSIKASARHSVAIWEMLSHNGLRSILVGWPATQDTQGEGIVNVSDSYHEPTAGPGVKPWPPPPGGTYWPETLGATLDQLRVSPENIQADLISQYVPDWQKIDQRRDRRLGVLRVLIAADLSYHAAATDLIRREAWDFAAVRFPAFGQIARIFIPYMPPKRKSLSDEDFNLFGGVIHAASRFFDSLLLRLLATAGEETAVVVVSGHGVHGYDISRGGLPPDDNEQWKAPYGIFAARGQGFAQDALVHGATVMDVAPTVLTWFGLPIGEDMEGRVLVEGFASPPEISRVASWESAEQTNPKENSNDLPPGIHANPSQMEYDWNFVRSCLEAARFEKALPILERLFRQFPERTEWGQTLFRCQLELKRLSEAKETLEVVLETIPTGAVSLLLRAELAWAGRNVSQTQSLVDEILKLAPTNPAVMCRTGILLLRLRQWDPLEKLARQALELDRQDPVAWLGLAEALLRKGQSSAAEEAAVQAIGLKYFFPEAHFILVRALLAKGKLAEAGDAMAALQKIQPDNRAAIIYSRRMSQA